MEQLIFSLAFIMIVCVLLSVINAKFFKGQLTPIMLLFGVTTGIVVEMISKLLF